MIKKNKINLLFIINLQCLILLNFRNLSKEIYILFYNNIIVHFEQEINNIVLSETIAGIVYRDRIEIINL